jgi:hypothetical protein
VAKTILACKDVKEFSLDDRSAGFALVFAIPTPFTKDLFLRNRPRNGRDDHRQNNEPKDLLCDRHLK